MKSLVLLEMLVFVIATLLFAAVGVTAWTLNILFGAGRASSRSLHDRFVIRLGRQSYEQGEALPRAVRAS